MDRICDYDAGFTRQEMFDETGHCLNCKANPKCPMHIRAIEEEYGVRCCCFTNQKEAVDGEAD